MFRESRMRLQTIHYIYATKGEITGMIAPAMVIVSIQVATVFAPDSFGAFLITSKTCCDR